VSVFKHGEQFKMSSPNISSAPKPPSAPPAKSKPPPEPSQVESKPLVVSPSSKPPSASTAKSKPPPEPPQAESKPEQKPASSPVTGGVDSKTQFLATQRLQQKPAPFSPAKPPASVKEENSPVISKAAGNGVSDRQDENGLTAKQLNTTGAAAAVNDAEIQKAAGGDQQIIKVLQQINTDAEGHKALRLALDRGTTYQQGNLGGSTVGLTEFNGKPKITLEVVNTEITAHETAHAAYEKPGGPPELDISHAEVYRFGERVASRLDGNGVPLTPGNSTFGTGDRGSSLPDGGDSGGGVSEPPSRGRPVPTEPSLTGTITRGGGKPIGGGRPTGGRGGPTGGGIPNVPDAQDENGLTAAQLNTDGAADVVTDAEIEEAAGGDAEIIALLKEMDTDAEGHKALRLALDKGTTYKQGTLAGNVIGLTRSGGGTDPEITLESMTLDTISHETAHAAYGEAISHAEVYRFGQRVQDRLSGALSGL
jgi:hypothetical protein